MSNRALAPPNDGTLPGPRTWHHPCPCGGSRIYPLETHDWRRHAPRIAPICHHRSPFSTIIPGGQSQAEALRYLADKVTTTQVTWNVDLEAGNSITFKLVDGTGATCYSAPVTVRLPPSLNAVLCSVTIENAVVWRHC